MNSKSKTNKWPEWVVVLLSLGLVWTASLLIGGCVLKALALWDSEPLTSQLTLMMMLSVFNFLWGLFITVMGLRRFKKLQDLLSEAGTHKPVLPP